MAELRETMLYLISVPVYILVIGIEILYSYIHNRGLYTGKGILANVYLTAFNMSVDLLVRGACYFVLTYFYQFHIADLSGNVFLYWTVLIVFQDFLFYWLHRVDHFSRIFWAVHVTHHSSEEFNLTVGFRSSVFQPLYRFIYFIPLALFGFEAIDIVFAYSAIQIFGILVHTQTVGKLGILEYVFVTPSHHRVHHASNTLYLDRNMGMFLIIWDRMFGTFQEEAEDEPVRFGLTTNLKKHDPLTLVFHEWRSIFADLKNKDLPWRIRLMYVFGPPGWSHDGSRKTSEQLREQEQQNIPVNGEALSH